jgi:N-acetylglucosamine malate deacetylase 1
VIDLAGQRVLVLAPHPDDETIGCGGLISKVKEHGGEVFVQMLAVGDTSDASVDGFSSADERDAELARVAELFGWDGYELVFRSNSHHLRLDAVPQAELIEAIESAGACSIRAVQPTIVAMPQPTSYNQDHRAVAAAALSALRPGDSRLRHQPGGVCVYEQIADQWNTGTSFTPNAAVVLEQHHLDAKLNAMRAYKSQVREHPSTRSVESLSAMAYYRGGQFGCERAEAYQVLRWKL